MMMITNDSDYDKDDEEGGRGDSHYNEDDVVILDGCYNDENDNDKRDYDNFISDDDDDPNHTLVLMILHFLFPAETQGKGQVAWRIFT
ncbi:unnamed protein product [Ilex paraguariensis]|uniref:Uncharacterized protein n=1 Tax=Ilex paraguariensis TaxID=185542 RepID=A0ABC8TJS4_9AQUA